MGPHDAVAAQIQRLLGEELVHLHAIGGDARHGRHGGSGRAVLQDLPAIEQILQAVAQGADVPAIVLAFEDDAIIFRLLKLDGDRGLAGGEKRETVLAGFERADHAVKARKRHGTSQEK
jgi:hypothetical protein